MKYVNNAYLKMIGVSRDQHDSNVPDFGRWAAVVHPEDTEKFSAAWVTATEEKQPFTVEYRLSRPWKSFDQGTGHEVTVCILISAAPQDIC